jgi:cysteine dioxygenase
MVLCWGAGRGSAIHDHPGCECLVIVLDGQMKESLYSWPAEGCAPETPLVLCNETVAPTGAVSWMNDAKGLHKLSQFGESAHVPTKNGDTGEASECGSVTLHLYTPPYKSCLAFTEGTAQTMKCNMCYYSVDGKRCCKKC